MNTLDQRRRDSSLTIRLTDREKERIKNNASKMRVSVTDYLVRLTIETPIGAVENIKPKRCRGFLRNAL